MIVKKFKYGDKVLIKSNGKCNGMCGVVVGIWEQYGYYNCLKVKVKNEAPYVNTTICVKESNLIKWKRDNNMAKLTGFSKVAVIRQLNTDYQFAIYDDGYSYGSGSKVIVSGDNRIKVINEIISSEEAAEKFKGDITAEVICPVDTSAYDERVNRRRAANKLKEKMDNAIKKIDEEYKYEMYAEKNPDLKAMLDQYKELIG